MENRINSVAVVAAAAAVVWPGVGGLVPARGSRMARYGPAAEQQPTLGAESFASVPSFRSGYVARAIN